MELISKYACFGALIGWFVIPPFLNALSKQDLAGMTHAIVGLFFILALGIIFNLLDNKLDNGRNLQSREIRY